MQAFNKLAARAAFVIFIAFLMHNLNALVIEPRVLGFTDPAVDYAKIDKLQKAMTSWPWMLSGLGHLLSGFAAMIIGFAVHRQFVDSNPIAARLALGAAIASACGFLLTGISNVGGAYTLELLAAQNPDQVSAIFLAATVMRVSFNSLAIVALGWFALQLSWCGIQSGRLPRSFCYFGYLAALSGLLMAFAYVPIYLVLYLFWSLWMGISFRHLREPD